jgi:hypothetical protein
MIRLSRGAYPLTGNRPEPAVGNHGETASSNRLVFREFKESVMTFPKKYGPAEIPPSVRWLLSVLLPQLIEGAHPAMEALRAQYRVAAITEVELTGVGFFVDFEVPPGPALTDPRNSRAAMPTSR